MPRLLFTLALLGICMLLNATQSTNEATVAVASSARSVNQIHSNQIHSAGVREVSFVQQANPTVVADTAMLVPHSLTLAADVDRSTATPPTDTGYFSLLLR